ncbi:MAG: hypothetical protein DLM63_09245 [Solirubrobacterales bacterium]|nr:MAG: hypothetical protein DLM63_09245 [Solirubrobacterales bacterium]
MGVRGRRPAAACPDCRLLERRVARRRGGRRPPAADGPAGRLERSRTAFSPTSLQDGCRLVTSKRARVARVVGVLPALYAHRLGRAYGPDSSLAALSRALQQPLDGVETDCCLTVDGELVLLHDQLLDLGTTVSGWAHQRTAAEIRAGVAAPPRRHTKRRAPAAARRAARPRARRDAPARGQGARRPSPRTPDCASRLRASSRPPDG